jgi:serine protease Do
LTNEDAGGTGIANPQTIVWPFSIQGGVNMKRPMVKPVALLITILMLFSLACSFSTSATPTAAPQATEAPKVEPTKEPVKVEPTKEAATEAPSVPTGGVTTLKDVKSATIQIQAEGTFIDPQVGLVVNGAGRGSGFIIDPSGLAITNNHVVTGSALLKVWVGGDKNKEYSAKVVAASECSDLAVIKIEGSDFPFLQWHDGAPDVSLEVYAAGFPLGDPEYTLTQGIVSKSNADGKTSWASVGSVLEQTARINPGNSGGPLVDKDGKVVGINYASNQSNQYFAIARAEVDKILSQLKAGTDVTSIGVNGQIVMSDDKSISGVWVSSVKSGSPADKSGVKPGDIITQLEGLVLGTDGTMNDYCQILHSHKPTDTLSLTVLRWASQEILEGQLNGRELAVTATFNSGTNSGNNSSSGTSSVSDDSNVITMEVPSAWEYDGSPWTNSWSIGNATYDFTAQTLTASPDVKSYSAGWDTTGIFVATSKDWGNIGGYAQLMEGVQSFYSDCKPAGRYDYSNSSFKGMEQDYTNCGTAKTNALVVTMTPKGSQAYLVLVEMKYSTQAELDALNVIFNTTVVNP